MTIRNWFKFFLNAMLIGGVITGILGLFIRWDDAFAKYFETGQWGEFFAALHFYDRYGLYSKCNCTNGLLCLFNDSSNGCKYF